MLTICSECAGDLRVLTEDLEPISKFYVSELACEDCDRRFLDKNKTPRLKEAAPMAKNPKPQDLPEMEDREIRPLHEAALEYAEIRDSRMALNKQEVELKGRLLGLMKQHGKETYAYDGVEVRIVHEEETVKVKVKAHEDDDADEGA